MQHLRALPVLALCILFSLAAVLPASAATPPAGNQPTNPEPQPIQTPAPDLSQAADDATAAALKYNLYLPSISTGPSATISAIEFTQATQNADQNVPMVANRPTVARVFLQFPGGLTGQTVQLTATRNGTPLAGSPLQRTGATAASAPNRANASDSTNFTLPAAWLSGSVAITARVMPNGKTLARTVNFQKVPPLRIMVVPIRYVHAPSGKTYGAPTAVAFPPNVQRMFPIPNVEIRWHAPITYRGNLTASASNRLASWNELLNIVLSLKQSEGMANDFVYMAILPTSIRSDNSIYYTGIGSSMRGTVSFDTNLTPAHELGHALGRAHAPCGGVVNADPNYPYAGASIGQLGFDTSNSTLLDPAVTTDVMSYCSEWISDYTYIGMYQNQRAAMTAAGVTSADEAAGDTVGAWPAATTPPAVDAVLVRALLDPGTEATLLPVYVLRAPLTADAPADAGAPSYTIAFVDAAGATLAAHTVHAAEAEEEDLSVRVLSALLPLPPGEVAAIEVRDGATTLARRAMRSAAEGAIAPIVSSDGVTLTLTLPTDTPQLVRLRQGERYITLGMDVVDGRLPISAQHLPAGASEIVVSTADLLPSSGATAAAAVTGLNLADAPPIVAIAPPATPTGGSGIVISGYASDATDGMLEPQWYVNGAAAGVGPLLQLDDSATQQFPIHVELRATDSAGHLVTDTMVVQEVNLQP